MTLDIQTLVLLNWIINIINAIVMAVIWRQYRQHFAGLGFIFADMVLQMVGFLLSLLRGILPAFIAIVLSNVFLLIGALLVLIGLEHFFGKKTKHLHNYIFLGLLMVALIFFGLIRPNLAVREICISIMIVLINAQSCWLLFRRVDVGFRQIARFTGMTLLVYVIVSLIRIVLLIILPFQTNDFFQSGLIDSVYITIYLVLSILITMNLFLMVSRRLLQEVQIQKEKYVTTFNSAPYAVILTRLTDGKIFEVNEGFERITGFDAADVVGKTTTEIKLWHQETDRAFIVDALSRGNEVRELEMQFRSKNNGVLIGLISSKIILVDHERCILTCVSDVTEMVTMRGELQALAMHDVLTGLPNRKLFYDRFELAQKTAQREHRKMAVISMDIDLLKSVNDQFGHHAGDRVLMEIGKRLSEALRKGNLVARFGGDEFVMLAEAIEGIDDVVAIVERIQRTVAKPINFEESIINVTMSIGIALFPEDGKDIDSLLKISDQAMYLAKDRGRNNYQYLSE